MHNRFFFVIAIFCQILLFSAAAPAAAESPSPGQELSLREALARGLQANFDLQASALGVPAAQAGIQAAKGRFDPQLVGSTGAGSDRVPPAEEDIAGFDRYYQASIGVQKAFRTGLSGDLTLGTERLHDNSPIDILAPQNRTSLVLDLTQPLLRDFGTEVNTTDEAIGKNALVQSEDRYLDRARLLCADIEAAYLRLCRAQGTLALRVEARRLAANLLAGNRKKFAAGIVPVNEVQEAETAVTARDEEVIVARQDVETAVNSLLDLLEAPGDDPLRIASFSTEKVPADPVTVPGFDDALREALADRPDLAVERLSVIARNIRLRYTRNQMLPRLDLQGTLGLNGLSGDPTGAAASDHGGSFSGGYLDAADRMTRGSGYQWFVGLRFAYPLGNRSAEARMEQAAVEKRRAIFELKRSEDAISTEVRNALVAVGRSRERMQVAERFRQLAQTSLDQESTRLRDGLSDTFHILRFQNDLIAAKLSQLDARIDYQLGLAALYKAMGTNLARAGILLRLPAATAGAIPLASN